MSTLHSHSHPFHALQEISTQFRPEKVVVASSNPAWSALGIRLGTNNLLIPAAHLVQIIRMRNLASPSNLPGSPAWVNGLVSYRGDLIPAIDLQHLLLGKPQPSPRTSKLVCCRNKQGIIGLMIPQIISLKNFSRDQSVSRGPAFEGDINQFLAGVFKQDAIYWGVLNLEKISLALRNNPNGTQP